jgi:hypothetical protein
MSEYAVELAPFHITVLRGTDLTVEAFNPRFARLLEEREIQDRPLNEVYESLWDGGVQLVHLAHEAFQQDSVRTTPRIQAYLPQAQNGAKESYFDN